MPYLGQFSEWILDKQHENFRKNHVSCLLSPTGQLGQLGPVSSELPEQEGVNWHGNSMASLHSSFNVVLLHSSVALVQLWCTS